MLSRDCTAVRFTSKGLSLSLLALTSLNNFDDYSAGGGGGSKSSVIKGLHCRKILPLKVYPCLC